MYLIPIHGLEHPQMFKIFAEWSKIVGGAEQPVRALEHHHRRQHSDKTHLMDASVHFNRTKYVSERRHEDVLQANTVYREIQQYCRKVRKIWGSFGIKHALHNTERRVFAIVVCLTHDACSQKVHGFRSDIHIIVKMYCNI